MMKRLLIIFAVAAFAFYSCTGGEDNVKIPSGVIPPDSMLNIFVDFHLVEAAIQLKQQQKQEPKKYSGYYYNFILKKHGITRKSWDHSLQFYSYHPKLVRSIYDKVLSELSKKQGRSVEKPSFVEERK
jgi:hypothetical protein